MLIEKYREIFQDRSRWKYYNKLSFPNNPFDNEVVRENFIYEYFKKGGKERVLDARFPKNKLRDIHSISTFFLGILLKPICTIPELKPDFRYLWFMTCLYHDFGYYIENEKSKYPPQNTDLSTLLSKLKIKHNLLNTNIDSLYQPDTIIKYYDYDRKERCSINHGIIGGLLLYDRLMKNFEENKQQAKRRKPDLDISNFEYKGLHWSASQEDFFKLVANSIISHNIWFAYNDDDRKRYKDNDLDSLIIDNQNQRISCESNPFLFLLLLADTIEPIKNFSPVNHSFILEKLNIEINSENEIVISVVDNCLRFEKWFDKIKDLENWTKVSVKLFDKMINIKVE